MALETETVRTADTRLASEFTRNGELFGWSTQSMTSLLAMASCFTRPASNDSSGFCFLLASDF